MAKKKPQAAYLAAPEDEPNFDALDQFLGGLEASKPAQELPNRGVLRGMADVALAGGRGAVQGVRMFTDLAGSDNAASRGLRTVEDFIGGLRSAQAKQDDQEAAAILKAAENAGILDQVVAGAKAFAVAPVSTLAQAVGTSIPTIGAALIPGVGQGAAVARMGAALGMGAAQGAGSVKGQIYDEVKQELLQAGASPEEAERRALEASSYDQSGGKIATGAALGALAGSTGMERAIGAIAHGTAKQAPGMARRVLTHGATEALPEAAQGAQEKLASNQALYEQGFDVAPGAGVVAAGTMEGLAGFGMGAAAGLPRPAVRAGDQLRAEGLQPERGPYTRASNAAVEAAANKIDFDPSLLAAGQKLQGMAGLEQAGTAPGAAAPKQTFGNEIAYTPDPDTGRLAIGDATEIAKANIARTAAKHEPMPQDVADGIVAKATERGLNMVAVPHPEGGGFTVVPREWVTAAMAAPQAAPAGPSVAERAMQAAESLTLEGDPAVAAAEQEARRAQIQSAPVDRAPRVRTPEPAAPAPAVPADVVAAYVESRRNDGTPAGRFFATEFDAGRITRDEVQGLIDAARPKSPDQRLAEAAAQAPKPQAPQPGDILNPKGEPFRNQRAAEKVAQREGGSVIVVDGGWSVRPKESDARTSNAPEPGGPAGEPVADDGRSAGTGELRDQRPADVPLGAAGTADEVRAGDGAAAVQPGRTGAASELTTDLPTLKRQWQAAVQAGDGATARAINDRIVALKANAAVQPATEAPASQAAAPGAVAAPTKANVPGAGSGAVEADGVKPSPLGLSEEQRRAAIDAETMEDRPDAPEVAQPTKGRRVKVYSRTLNGINDVTAHLYELPGYKGPQLAVKEYKSSRGQGYRVYLPKSGAFIADSNGVSSLDDTLKLAVLRIGNARDAISKRHASASLAAAPEAEKPSIPKSKKVSQVKAKREAKKTPAPAAPETAASTTQGERNGDEAQAQAQEVLKKEAPADVTTAGATATHADPGEAAEPATPAVVAESITKAAKREDRKPSEMKADLLRQIDAKLADAQDEYLPTWKAPTKDQIRKAMVGTGITNESRIVQMLEGQHQNRVAEAADRIGYVMFDVPGDGKFKVLNTKSKLTDFRRQVESSPGFKNTSSAPKPEGSSGGEKGYGGAKAAIEGMIDEGDAQAAVDYAAMKGLDLAEVLKGQKDRLAKVAGLTPTADGDEAPAAEPAAPASAPAPAAATKRTGQYEASEVFAIYRAAESAARGLWSSSGAGKHNTKLRKGLRELGLKQTQVDNVMAEAATVHAQRTRGSTTMTYLSGQDFMAGARRAGVVPEQATAAPAPAAEPTPAAPKQEAAAEQPAPQPEKQEAAPAENRLDNFGEALPPARRNMAAKLTEDLADDDIAKRPLSEIWPLAENEAIEDSFAAAVAHAARAEIPSKPRQPYKLRLWVEKVKTLRGLAGRIVSGEVTRDRMGTLIDTQFRSLRDWWSKVQLLGDVSRDQWKRIGSVEERPDAIAYEDGKQVQAPTLRIEIDGKGKWLHGDVGVDGADRGTVGGNKAGIMAMLNAAEPEKRMKFEIRRNINTGEVFINKEGDAERRRLMTFASVEEARKAIAEQYDELVSQWEGVKARDNITERDLRGAENRPRAGKDHRKGRDVTPNEFQQTFGFRGGEFGKWVEQGKGDKERQALLNSAFDALMDLSDMLHIPPRAISLNGTLGIAFGSRGSGWASAHFEPSNLVINLTKTRGAGALAHEWFHALDNYFSRLRRDGEEAKFTGDKDKYRNDNYITHQPEALMVRKDRSRHYSPMTASALKARHAARQQKESRTGWPPADAYAPENWERDPSIKTDVRPEVEVRFADLVKALNDSPMTQRSRRLDKGSRGYWGSTLERAARAFENFVQARMQEQGYHNDFLANVLPVEEMRRNPERYPYLLPGEVKPIADAFDALFSEVKTREDDAGNVAMFSRGGASPGRRVDLASAQALADQLASTGLIRLNVVQSVSDMPLNLQRQLSKSAPDGRVRGAYFRGTDEVWMVADHIRGANEFVEVALHEAFHRGLGKTIPDAKPLLREIWRTNQNVRKATADQMRQHGIGRDEAIEEALAKMAEAGEVRDLKGWPKLLEAIRTWLGKMARAVGIEMVWTDDMVADLVAASTREGLKAGVHADVAAQAAAAKRAPTVTVETDEATGAPVYATDDISIGFPQETERFEYVLQDGEKIVNYSIGPADGFDSYGFVELVIGADGIPKALADIEVKPELRGQGIGDKVMAAILGAHPGVDLEISNIVEGARGFWAKMGVPEQNRAAGEAYDGTLNYQTFQEAQDERAANRAAAGRGAAGEGRNARAEDRAQGADGQAQGLMLSRAEPSNGLGVSRRNALIAIAASAAGGQAKADVTLGKAKAIAVEVLEQALPAPIASSLTGKRDSGVTEIQGAPSIKRAMQLVADTGPEQLRSLARQIASMLPDKGVMLTIHGKGQWNAHGAVTWGAGGPHMQLMSGEGHTGLTYGTFIHEAMHLAVLARYQTLGVGVLRNNDKVLGMTAPAAAKELAQFKAVWEEFDKAAGSLSGIDEKTKVSVSEARRSPDEFFVRALTDARLQAVMAKMKYEGTTLLERFKDWIKSALFGFKQEGTAASWLDAALEASNDLVKSMAKDDGDFSRMRKINEVQSQRSASEFADGQAVLSRAEPADATDMRSAPVVRQIQQRAHELLATKRTFNWWHRTVGTQYHKAQVDADFGKVYTAAQDFIHDTSAFANDPANLAPDLLPQLKSLGDLKKTLGLNKRDRESMAAAVFEGTLDWMRDDSGQPVKAGPDDTAGIVWTPAELRERFGFNDRQVKLYEQFRASVDRSLDTLVASDVVRLLGSDLPPGMRALVSSGDLGRFKGLVTAFLQDAPGMGDVADQVAEKYDRIEELKARGYAPLMRFGRYTVDVVSEDGERKFFGLYESEAEANRAARQFKEGADPGDEVTQGVLSEEAYKQFQGMTPETLELFAEVAGVEKNEVFQEYLKRAKNNRSALKRLIHRKGIAGYSEDASRVLAQFLTSNARAASSNLHLGEMAKAVQDIPKQKGDVIDEAIRLREYVQTPQEEAQALRGLLFASFLGGSVASAMVNLTQPLMMTLPYLSQFGGPAKAAARLMGAMGAALGNYDRDSALGKALAMAEKEGIVSPQEMHQLQAEASGSLAGHPALRRLTFAWGSLFSAAEQFNRRLSFVAAYNTAVAEGKADPAAFAAKAVEETQGVYNKGNKPRFARGTVGAVAFTFKQYSVSYMEFLKRLPTRERTLALAVLLLAAGAQGMPGADDLDDLIDTLGQGLGYDTNAKLWKTRVLSEAIGSDGADFVLRGFSALPGFPLDVAGRLGLGNMIPGTGLLLKSKQDKAGEVAEALGPAASLAKGVASAVPALTTGNVAGVVEGIAPKAVKDLVKSLEMYRTGEYRDTKGRKVTEADATDALVKGLGFQPAQVARDSRRVQMANQQIALAKVTEAEFAEAIARARVDGDPDGERKARQRLAEWNARNPESRIAITPSQVARRARELRTTRDERFIRTAPKEMRQSIRETMQ